MNLQDMTRKFNDQQPDLISTAEKAWWEGYSSATISPVYPDTDHEQFLEYLANQTYGNQYNTIPPISPSTLNSSRTELLHIKDPTQISAGEEEICIAFGNGFSLNILIYSQGGKWIDLNFCPDTQILEVWGVDASSPA